MTEKKRLEDVVPLKIKRSIRDIPVPARKKASHNKIPVVDKTSSSREIDVDKITGRRPADNSKNRKIRRYVIVASVFIFLFIVFFTMSAFDNARVTIVPKSVETTIDKKIDIIELDNRTNPNMLGYRTIEIDDSVSKQVSATGEEFIQSRATGTITIFNEYSPNQQTLIRNTRFESPNGLIYTIVDSAPVPGYTIENNTIIPGQIDAEVIASSAGNEYNLNQSEFTIPGFRGQEPYELFYAKTKTPISGGFNGVKKIVEEGEIARATTELRNELIESLSNKLRNQISDEFIVVYDTESFSFDNITQNNSNDGDGAILSLSGKVVGKVINKIELSNVAAKGLLIDYTEEQNVLIKDIEKIDINIVHDEDMEPVLSILGQPKFVWQNDEIRLKEALKSVSKAEFGTVLSTFSGISRADVVIRPFWQNKFPDNIDNIDLTFITE